MSETLKEMFQEVFDKHDEEQVTLRVGDLRRFIDENFVDLPHHKMTTDDAVALRARIAELEKDDRR